MRTQISACCLLLICLLVMSCGSGQPSNTASSNKAASNIAGDPTPNSNIVPYVPANTAAGSNVAEAFNSNVAVERPAIPANAKPMTYPAPDDSEYWSTMEKSGYPVETRVFKSDAHISKVVKTWLSVKDKKITIYLKNGKTVNLPGDKLEDIRSVPVSTFHDAAGIKTSKPPTTPIPGKPKTDVPSLINP